MGNTLYNMFGTYEESIVSLSGCTAIGTGSWGINNAGNNYICRKGKIVTLFLEIIITENITANKQIGTIPANFRPYRSVGGYITGFSPSNSSIVKIINVEADSGGRLTIFKDDLINIYKNDKYKMTLLWCISN